VIARSMSLQSRRSAASNPIHSPPAERAAIGNPLVPQINRLKAPSSSKLLALPLIRSFRDGPPNSGLPEFGDVIVQVGNSRLETRTQMRNCASGISRFRVRCFASPRNDGGGIAHDRAKQKAPPKDA